MSFKTSEEQEKYLAELFGGRVQKNSGQTWTQKGDILTDKFLIEAKLRKKNLNVSILMLETIKKQAIKANKVPLLVSAFKDSPEGEQFVVIRLANFMNLLGSIK